MATTRTKIDEDVYEVFSVERSKTTGKPHRLGLVVRAPGTRNWLAFDESNSEVYSSVTFRECAAALEKLAATLWS